jgi:glycosyltransferase involved in cell wall biosynthesis
MQPLITCIVPAYDAERYLGEALDSILAQAHRPLQVIVADDGSTDGTATVAAAYGERVELLRQDNSGSAAARNLGLGAARGDFIAFLDADDLWHPHKLERQMARFRARPELDYCVTHIQNFWVEELVEERERFKAHPRGQPLPGFVTSTLLARRALFERVGSFNTRFLHSDDTDWYLRASRAGAVLDVLPDVLVYRRLHPSNRSRQRADESRDDYLRLVKETLDRRRRIGAVSPTPGAAAAAGGAGQ